MNTEGLKYFLASNDHETISFVKSHFCGNTSPHISYSTDAETALFELLKQKFDVVFIDIDTDSRSGIELAHLLKQQKYSSKTFLISSDKLHAVDAIKVGAIGFIPKPIKQTYFELELTKLTSAEKKEQIETPQTPVTSSAFKIIINRKDHQVTLDQIVYIEADRAYCNIHLKDGTHGYIHSSLKKMKEQLPSSTFLSINRSCIINSNFLHSVDKNSQMCQLKISYQTIDLKVSLRNMNNLLSNIS